MRALNMLRAAPRCRREAFSSGLAAAGFQVRDRLDRPEPGDVLVIWNRYSGTAETAAHFESMGARVLVAENCPLGNDWRGGAWFSLAGRHVAMTGGDIRDGGASRWDGWGVELAPFRADGTETVILAQRGIGHNDVRSPVMWAETTQRKHGGRIRTHPGNSKPPPLADDLENAKEVITWSSAGAVQALAMGIPVWHDHPQFAMAAGCRRLSLHPSAPARDEAARLAAFRRLAWAMWTVQEIESGEAFGHLLAAA